MTRCARCNDPFEFRTAKDTRCVRCEVEVTRLIEADERRRAPRFVVGKDLTRWAA